MGIQEPALVNYVPGHGGPRARKAYPVRGARGREVREARVERLLGLEALLGEGAVVAGEQDYVLVRLDEPAGGQEAVLAPGEEDEDLFVVFIPMPPPWAGPSGPRVSALSGWSSAFVPRRPEGR